MQRKHEPVDAGALVGEKGGKEVRKEANADNGSDDDDNDSDSDDGDDGNADNGEEWRRQLCRVQYQCSKEKGKGMAEGAAARQCSLAWQSEAVSDKVGR